MKRLLSTLLAAIGILAVLAVGAVVYVTTFLDPEDLKPRLEEVVQERVGLTLSLEGPISWSFYPRLGVGVEQAEAWLPEQSAGEDPAFMAFRRAEVSLAFASLLRGEVAIDGMTLDGLRLNLARDEDGRGNWESLMERFAGGDDPSTPASASSAPVPGGGNGPSVAFNIASVEVKDGEVSYTDRAAGHSLRLKGLSVTGRNVNPRRSFPFTAGFQLLGHDTPAGVDDTVPRLASEVTMKGRLALALAERRYTLEDLSLATRNRLAGVESPQQLELSGQRLVVDMAARQLRLEPGTLKATLAHSALGDTPLSLAMEFALESDLAAGSARLRDLTLSGDHGLRLSGNLNLANLHEAPRYDGQLRLAPLSLRPWLERFDSLPATADPEALSDVALTTPLEGDLERVDLTGMTLVLDGSTFTGRLAAGLDGHRLETELQGDRLDLDAYLPASTGQAPDAAGLWLPGVGRAHAQDEEALLPVEWLRELALDARLSLSSLRLGGLDFRDVALRLEGRDGRQRLVSLESAFYEGSLAADGELDLSREPIAWRLAPRLERVRIDALLEALGEGEEPAPLRGRAFVEGELTTQGNAWPVMKRGLDGRLAARLDDGAILDVNVSRELCSAVASLQGEQTKREWEADTRFERAEATLSVRDGVVESDDIIVTLPGIDVGGEGTLDLTSERFDLRAAARVVDTADVACEVNPRLERLPLPVRCEGSLSGDSAEWCRFDREGFTAAIGEALREELGSRAGDEVEQRLEGALDKLEERVGEDAGRELRDALKGLFE
ncbi:AsmA family protein [Halomonas alimentaria]|uniref:AsmA family protein n=1 Tax=Halomonas alimentaria TaxID=147248 RepID=A0A7X4W1X0_9GAMM|nr:AsmA family protein [Halomonas alimentaria]NAW32905.1 AsmA family protein [Halomonas alimentaria]